MYLCWVSINVIRYPFSNINVLQNLVIFVSIIIVMQLVCNIFIIWPCLLPHFIFYIYDVTILATNIVL